MNMDDLMKALNQASGAQGAKGGQSSGGQPDLGSLLGGLMGGGSGQQGGGQPDLGSLLGGLMGGGSAGAASGGPFDALARPLAEKLGISPQIASMVVMFLANALLSNKAGSRSGAVDSNAAADLSQVVKMLDSGQVNNQALQGNQLVQDLSKQTGLDQQTAARSIGALAEMLGGQQGLEGLLGK